MHLHIAVFVFFHENEFNFQLSTDNKIYLLPYFDIS